MKKKFLLASIAFVMLAGVTKIASAQTTELETQVVTSSKSQAKVEQMSLYTTIISQDDIKKSTAQTLDQLLKEVPGFNFSSVPSTQTDPTGQSTKLRGVGTARVLVLLDGIPLLDPFYSTTQFFKIQLANVDHVEVVRGGNSSIWGNMAVAGVVNVITKRVKDNSGEVNISYGSFGSNNVSVSKNFTEKKELGINLSVDQMDSRGYGMTPIELNYQLPGRGLNNAKDTNIQLTTYFAPKADLSGFVRMGYHIQNQDIAYQYGNNLMKSPDISGTMSKKISDDRDLSISGWSQLVSLDKNNGAACYYKSSNGNCKGGYPSSTNSTSQSDVTNTIYQYLRQKDIQQYRETGGALLFAEKIKGKYFKDYQVGIDFRKIAGSDYQENYAIPSSYAWSGFYETSQITASGSQLYAGIFAQTRIAPDEKTTVNLSSRIDTYNGNTAAIPRSYASSSTSGFSTTTSSATSTNKTSFNPTIGIRREIDDQLSMRGAVYKSFRGPGLNQTVRSYGQAIANPDLGLETLYGKEIGLDWSSEKATINATYFYYDIKNMITTYKGMNANGTDPQLVQDMCGGSLLPNCLPKSGISFGTNNDDGISKGIELSGKYIFTPELTAGAWYTNTNTFMSWKGTSSISTPLGVQSVAVPKIMAGASMTYKLNEKAQTTLQARYIGKMYTDITTSASTYYEQGANIVYDTNLRYKYSRETDMFMSIANLLNKNYSENDYTSDKTYGRTLSPPRVITIGAKVGF